MREYVVVGVAHGITPLRNWVVALAAQLVAPARPPPSPRRLPPPHLLPLPHLLLRFLPRKRMQRAVPRRAGTSWPTDRVYGTGPESPAVHLGPNVWEKIN